jgi:Kelch motif
MGFLRACVHVVVAFVVASCGFPRPADVPDDDTTTGPKYQLLAVTPPVATTDDTLTLEGTFASSATVAFPGGAVQPATVLGEHRATVIVPAAATAGDLTVTTGGVTLGPLAFRRTSFALGLQQLRASYEQADGGRQSAALVTPRLASTSVIVKNWLYVLGGTDGLGALGSIERAPINADSTIDSFDDITDAMLATPRSGHASLVVGNSLYVIGGLGAAGALKSVERAVIQANGSLGSFALVDSVALTTARTGHTATIIGSSIYVIGGVQSDGKKLSSVERAVIQPDGSLGPFEIIAGVALVTPRSHHASEVIGNTLYVIAGDAGNSIRLGDVERTVIQPDGTLGPFHPVAGVSLTVVRSGHRSVVIGNGLYAIGGTGTGGVSASVERAPIAADGSLAPFAPVSGLTLSAPRTGLAVATVGTALYVLGGSDPVGPVRTVEHASLNADSAVGPFATADISLVVSEPAHTTTVIRDFLYVIGGQSTTSSVERAPIRPDGSLGPFATVAGLSLPSPRPGHTAVVIRNFLYVLGGGTGGGGFPTSIERAVINNDGSLGPFTTVLGVTLNQGRMGHVSVVLGDFLYVIGGFCSLGAVGRMCSVERATITPNGTLGAFVTVPGVGLTTGRNLFTALVTSSYVYVMGGASDAGELASVERASIGGDGELGTFITISSGTLLVPRISPANVVIGNALYVIGGRNNTATVTTMERATINADGSLSALTTVLGFAPATPRASHTATAIADSLYLIGGNVDILHSVEHASLR